MNFPKKQKVNGFTFIEIIIAVFIFALMMMAVAGIFSSSIGGYQKARAVQKNLEDAQFVMNQIAKILRTSSIADDSFLDSIVSDSIVVFDYSQGKCFRYTFDGNKIKFGKREAPVLAGEEKELFEKDPIAWCNSNKPNAPTPMADLNVTGKFKITKSKPSIDNENGVLGKVTISMKVCSNVGCTADKADIQTSVSLRDYYNAGI